MNAAINFVDRVLGPSSAAQLTAREYRNQTQSHVSEARINTDISITSVFDNRASSVAVEFPELDGAIDSVRSFVASDEVIRSQRCRAAVGIFVLHILKVSQIYGNIADTLPPN